MARKSRENSEAFIQYQSDILNHSNYDGLEYGGSWVRPGKSEVGKLRKAWADAKIEELSISGSGIYAKVMYELHPYKTKPCQTCGKTMSLNYVYPHKNLQKILLSKFPELADKDIALLEIDKISTLIAHENKSLFREVLSERLKGNHSPEASTSELLCLLIEQSKERRSNLGPGAMSNFPDRYDGFHSYNLCCRSKEDTGRHASNLKTYSTDRRAYENWSDGNHRAANQLMGNQVFLNTGLSADHLGPVSLGFVHDPRFMAAIPTSDNSSKRDRLILKDLQTVMLREQREGIDAASWYCKIIWQKMQEEITRGLIGSDEDLLTYYNILQKNKILFFFILNTILESENGLEFLESSLKMRFRRVHGHEFDYTFETNSQSPYFGKVISATARNSTNSSIGEVDRFVRVSLEAIAGYAQKDNRRTTICLDETELSMLEELKQLLKDEVSAYDIEKAFEKIMNNVQHRLLNK